ncbi:MAG: GNAT family N-acetyltransferase [Verrucomicrobiales bacterium]|nr:GNAT family N-acetyltransferase [Verrucomicrobiales bacterium]
MATAGPKILWKERAFFQNDLEALAAIEREAGDAAWTPIHIKYFTCHLTMDTRVITTDISDEPIAFYVVEHGDESLSINNIAVDPKWRRLGVASFALGLIETLARELNYRQIILDVQEQNLPAQLLYRKAGFQVAQIRKDHYDPGEDGYRMVKEVHPR